VLSRLATQSLNLNIRALARINGALAALYELVTDEHTQNSDRKISKYDLTKSSVCVFDVIEFRLMVIE